ncbi:MAG: hypothetical protein K0Q60_4077 [Microvirga sp.]|nr:hypothetical protein [Microvirga sp.]
MVIVRLRDMGEMNVSSVRTYRQIGRARNQPTEEEIDIVQDQETTGAVSEDRPDEQGEDVVQNQETTGAANEDRPDEQGEDVVQDEETTGAASEDRPNEQAEDAFQQSERDDKDLAEGEEARQKKMTQIRDLWSGTN